MKKLLSWILLSLLILPGCVTTYDYDKTTVASFTFGIGFLFVREKEAEVKSIPTEDAEGEIDADTLPRDTP